MNVHFGVSGILSKDKHVLLGKRRDDDEALPGMWCSPGGGLEPGETILDCLKREFREEVGLDVIRESRSACVQMRTSERGTTVLAFYRVMMKDFRQMPLPLDGFSEVKWFHLTDCHTHRANITPMTFAAILELANL